MKKIKEIVEEHPNKQNPSISDSFLELAKKDERGVIQGTGPHTVKLISGEITKRDTQFEQGQEGIMLNFKEGDEEKKYFVPMYGKGGKFHYLFERFADIKEGENLIMEFRKKGLKGFIDVQRVDDPDNWEDLTANEEFDEASEASDDEDIPVID